MQAASVFSKVAAAAALATGVLASAAEFQGRRLGDVLAELRAGGLDLVYSSAVVDERLLVTVEPVSRDARRALDEILAPLGLAAEAGPAGAVLIVRAISPTGRLSGRVVSDTRGTPVGNASVTIARTALVARTKADGSFRFDDVPAGRAEVRVEGTGFSEGKREAVVPAGGAATVLLELHPLPRFVEEIVVVPSRRAVLDEDPVARSALDPRTALRTPAIGGDVSRMLELLPGVAAPDNSAALNVRGGTSRDVSFVLDGLELYEPFHLKDFQSPFTVVDPALAGAIELSSGGGTVERGDRHGGFIDIATAPPPGKRDGRVELGTMNTRLAYGGPAPAGSILATGRMWYPDAVRETIELGEDGLDPRFSDAYARYAVTSIPGTVLSAHLLAARDELEFVEADGAEHVDATSRSLYVWLRMMRAWSDVVSTETVLSSGTLDRRRRGVSEPEDVAIAVDDRREVRFFGLRHQTDVRLSDAHLLRAGVEARPLDGRYDYAIEEDGIASRSSLSPGGTSYGVFLAYRAAPTDRLAFETGIRWDRQAYLDDAYFSPRVHLVWRPGPRSELKVSAGRHFQSQRIHELSVPDGQTTFEPAERSDQVDVSFRHRFRANLELRIDGYGRRITGPQTRWENLFDPLELFPETEVDRIRIAASRADLRGVELTLRGEPDGPWFWWVGYAWSRATENEDGRDVPRSWDQPHAARGLVGYSTGRWSVSLAGSAHTGWPTTAVLAHQEAGPGGSTIVVSEPGPRNAERFPLYVRADLQLARSIPIARGRLYLRLDVINLTDRDNVCCVDDFAFTPRPDGSVTVTPEQEAWLGITPSLALGWEF